MSVPNNVVSNVETTARKRAKIFIHQTMILIRVLVLSVVVVVLILSSVIELSTLQNLLTQSTITLSDLNNTFRMANGT